MSAVADAAPSKGLSPGGAASGDRLVSVTFPLTTWNGLIEVLAKLPFVEVARYLTAIGMQLAPAVQPSSPPPRKEAN